MHKPLVIPYILLLVGGITLVSWIERTEKGTLTKLKSVATEEGQGAKVNRLFPTSNHRNEDPFVLLDEFFVTPPAGFSEHPHRGFEAITYMLEGSFNHADNLGNNSTVSAGGVQRFTAGKGIRHSEMPGSDGVAHGLQLWINLPKVLKKVDPSYQAVQANQIPEETMDNGIIKRTVVGEKSPVMLRTDILYVDYQYPANVEGKVELFESHSGIIYLLSGSIEVNGESLQSSESFLIKEMTELKVKSSSDARFVIITGEPHDEPIRQRGPYVD